MESGDNTGHGRTRQLIELATSCGRKYQNEQTGFIHYFYTKEDEKDNGAIPVYENLLFALALMRSRSADTIQEGKALIEKILPFQNRLEEIGLGGFPIYLHEYPHCKDRLIGIRLLPVFNAILRQFHHVIGSSLKAKMIETTRLLLTQALKTHKEKPVPFQFAFSLGTVTQALGKFLEDSSLVEEGTKIVEELELLENNPSLYIPENLSELLIGMQAADISTLPKGWDKFWHHLSNTWHRSTGSYIGPGWRESQRKNEPQPGLYDLYMGFATGGYSYRSFEDHIFLLQAALISSEPVALPQLETNVKGNIGVNSWFVSQGDLTGLCLLGKKEPIIQSQEKGYTPLKIIWGDRTRAHSFVCQEGNMETISYEWHPDGLIGMEVTLGKIAETEEKEKNRELIFFTEALEGTDIRVGGVKATTFGLGDQLSIASAGINLEVTFHLVEGSGSFIGHIMRGNRSSQIALKGEDRLSAFDWQIFMRSVHRSASCKFRVEIGIKKEG